MCSTRSAPPSIRRIRQYRAGDRELLSVSGGDIALVTPAFPETGRTVYLGHLFVNGQPLDESPLKDHPLNPIAMPIWCGCSRASRAARPASSTCRPSRAEPDAIKARLDRFTREGAARLSRIGLRTRSRNARQKRRSTCRLHRRVRPGSRPRPRDSALRPGFGKRRESDASAPSAVLPVVAGSCSAATLKQLDAAERHMPVLRLDTEKLLAGSDEISAAVAWAGERIAQARRHRASAAPEVVSRLQAPLRARGIRHAIETATAAIAANW